MRTHLTVIGNLTSDPTVRWTKDGVQLAEFGLAQNDRRLDRTTGLWESLEPTFYTVTCWRRLAEGVSRLHKGDPVVVYGRFTTRQYQRTDGQVRSELRIEADAVGPDLQWVIAAVTRRSPSPVTDREAPATPPLAPVPDLDDEERDDLPPEPDPEPSEFAPAVGD